MDRRVLLNAAATQRQSISTFSNSFSRMLNYISYEFFIFSRWSQ